MTDRDLIADARDAVARIEAGRRDAVDAMESPDVTRRQMRPPRMSTIASLLTGLADALEAKHTQHAETLSLLEHAYEVIETGRQPPLGFVVVSRREKDKTRLATRCTPAVWPAIPDAQDYVRQCTDSAVALSPKDAARYFIAELREVPDEA